MLSPERYIQSANVQRVVHAKVKYGNDHDASCVGTVFTHHGLIELLALLQRLVLDIRTSEHCSYN